MVYLNRKHALVNLVNCGGVAAGGSSISAKTTIQVRYYSMPETGGGVHLRLLGMPGTHRYAKGVAFPCIFPSCETPTLIIVGSHSRGSPH